jgi:protease I
LNEQWLDGMKVAIVVADDFEQAELIEPRKVLIDAGAQVSVVAPHAGQVQGIKHDEKANKVAVDMTLDMAHPDDFDAVMLRGGALNADTLRMVQPARQFVRAMDQSGKPVAAICHAPWLLVSAGLVRDRTLTSYHTIQDDIRNAGGKWEDRDVVRHRNWVTSRQPKDIPAFNREMIRLLAEQRAERRAGENGITIH